MVGSIELGYGSASGTRRISAGCESLENRDEYHSIVSGQESNHWFWAQTATMNNISGVDLNQWSRPDREHRFHADWPDGRCLAFSCNRISSGWSRLVCPMHRHLLESRLIHQFRVELRATDHDYPDHDYPDHDYPDNDYPDNDYPNNDYPNNDKFKTFTD